VNVGLSVSGIKTGNACGCLENVGQRQRLDGALHTLKKQNKRRRKRFKNKTKQEEQASHLNESSVNPPMHG
jgi:hypothetical protein